MWEWSVLVAVTTWCPCEGSCPALPDFAYGDKIQVRHLLAHSAGLPNPIPIKWIHLIQDQTTFNENAFFQTIFQQNKKVSGKPNERFAYSNLGFVALGQLIERVTGMPYRDYITDQIIKPLGMSAQLGFERKSAWGIATGYQKAFSFGNLLLTFLIDKTKFMGKTIQGWACFRPFYVNGSAYGGLIGNPYAFIAFAQDLLKRDSKLLPAGQRREMFQENHLNNGRPSGMCLGWFCGQLNEQFFVAHAGGGGGYYCELRLYPEKGLGSIVMTNRSGFSDERMLDRFDSFLLTPSAP